MIKRIICAGLACLTIMTVLASCGSSEGGTTGTTDGSAAAVATVAETTAEPQLQSSLPDGLKYNGETVRVLNCGYFADDYLMMDVTEQNGDVVNDAIYARNLSVQEKLNVKLEYINMSLHAGDPFATTISKSIMAGADDYDIISSSQYEIVKLTTKGLFANMKDAPYIDLEKPWWDKAFIEEINIGNKKTCYLTGDISLNVIRNMGCVYYNKQMYRDNFGDPDELYKLVLDGKWTLDKFMEIVKSMYKDLDGDTKYGDADQYGCGVITSNLTDHLTLASGVRFSTKDSENIPQLDMNNERNVEFVDKLFDLFYNNPGCRVFPSAEETNNVLIPGKFSKNELLFDLGWFYTSELLRDMPGDYGIIPYPKLDETIPNYYSLAHDILPLFALPTTCQKTEMSCAVLEEMAFEGYRDVVPAFYEVALKKKYVRDSNDTALKIVDMIRAGCTTDFIYVYGYALNNVGYIMRDLTASKKNTFVSSYEKKEPSAKAKLEELVNVYLDE